MAETEQQSLGQFTEQAYLNYAMYVILDRALPSLADGLKPVQRRIVYAMSELGLKATAKYKKSARTVGDVLGKFHPHGDSACYEAMVLMAQDFSYRYPLIDGQGNWGSADDPKSFAAMRYTESRLASYAQSLLEELGQGTVAWTPNFDGTLDEPCLLPARLPNVLLNGSTGIAVGMATDIPPHNLREVANACVYLLENPKATLDDLMGILPGPDYPTAAEIITPREQIRDMYKTGHGSIRMRAIYEVDKGDIVITALPHQVSGAKVLEQIAQQMQARKLPLVADLRDESDHENPTRLVIIPRSNRINTEELMSHLFATTDLERNYRINLNMIGLDGKPRVKNLLEILSEWLSYRTQTVTKRLEYRLNKILDRLHILEGLLIAFLNIDEVIKIIREADNPKTELIKQFKLSERQAEAILEIKLRQLAKLEEFKLRTEQAELGTERDAITALLESPRKLKTLIRKEIEADAQKYGDNRKSMIVERNLAQALREEAIVTAEPMTVVISKNGWVRAAKGHDIDPLGLSYKAGDDWLATCKLQSNQNAIFFDNTGRAYTQAVHSLPSARGQGEPLTGRCNLPAGAYPIGMIGGEPTHCVLLASSAGYGFMTKLDNLITKNRSGKTIVTVPPGAKLLPPDLFNPSKTGWIACLQPDGYLLLFPQAGLPELPRGKGNKLQNIGKESLLACLALNNDQSLVITAGKRQLTLKPKDLADYVGERGRKGKKLPRGYQQADNLSKI